MKSTGGFLVGIGAVLCVWTGGDLARRRILLAAGEGASAEAKKGERAPFGGCLVCLTGVEGLNKSHGCRCGREGLRGHWFCMIRWSVEDTNLDKGTSQRWHLGFSFRQLGNWQPFIKMGTMSGRAGLRWDEEFLGLKGLGKLNRQGLHKQWELSN